jgi:hypothetical protein
MFFYKKNSDVNSEAHSLSPASEDNASKGIQGLLIVIENGQLDLLVVILNFTGVLILHINDLFLSLEKSLCFFGDNLFNNTFAGFNCKK